jgi:cytochrome b subunit of formate dehydrogenase
MSKEQPTSQAAVQQPSYNRFDLPQRIEHLVFLLSFTILGVTGLAQKYAMEPLGAATLAAFGGIEMSRQIHRISAFVMMLVSAYHILSVLYRVYVLRVPLTMMPVIEDFKHLFQDIAYYLGFRKHKAYYGRYNYAEKVEYTAVVWGTIVMGLTGFMMWNPITTARLLPGEAIPAAKAAHSGEALLAVLAIIIWHFYHVHLKKFNKSMFTGELSREEMLHEHPAELAEIESGKGYQPPAPALIRQRQRVYYPVAGVLTVVMLGGIVGFLTIEETSLTTVPPRETVQVFAPLTPTPRPTLAPTPTVALAEGINPNSWAGSYEALFRNRCSTCHGFTSVGGLSLATYQQALQGGNSGPGIVPGDPDRSSVVIFQSDGKHPGQLTIDELNAVIEWIKAGAPER